MGTSLSPGFRPLPASHFLVSCPSVQMGNTLDPQHGEGAGGWKWVSRSPFSSSPAPPFPAALSSPVPDR